MKFYKTRNVKTPNRGTSKSAGVDFFVPEDFKDTILDPGDSVVIPSGIKANIPEDHVFIANNKSGIATKRGLQVGACVVDEDYQGEIHIHLTNVTNSSTIINSGDKIIQFLLLPVSYEPINLVESEDKLWEGEITERGEGKFGSTGIK